MFGEMQQKSSGGGTSFDIFNPDVYGASCSSDNLSGGSSINVTVTQRPKWIVAVIATIDTANPLFAVVDVDNSLMYYIGRGSNGWICTDVSTSLSVNFPTISSSQVTYKNGNSSSPSKKVGLYIYY